MHLLLRRIYPLITIIVGLSALAESAFGQVTITRTITNLQDTTPGQDLWSASYVLGGTLPKLDEGFTIYFDAALYRNLSGSYAAAAPQWDVLLIQPDTGLSAPGFLDGLALVALPTFTGPFAVTYTWLGTGTPGAENFEIYSLKNGFDIIGSGRVLTGVITPVPESSSLAGFGALLCGLCILARTSLRSRVFSKRFHGSDR